MDEPCETPEQSDDEEVLQCIACFDETDHVYQCCNAPCCKDCQVKWLRQDRLCMHCHEERCSEETWNEFVSPAHMTPPPEIVALSQTVQGVVNEWTNYFNSTRFKIIWYTCLALLGLLLVWSVMSISTKIYTDLSYMFMGFIGTLTTIIAYTGITGG